MRRDPYLDFLRALAIVMVLIHHVSQQWPVPLQWLTQYTHHGAAGVDLFFALSGFLIGGLFWREARQCGTIHLGRFWSRRWLRTIPPYLAGLGLAYTAVLVFRAETFDFGYLLFLQNYYDTPPFFLVSWSLCVEEHFYLLVPLLFFLLIRIRGTPFKNRLGFTLFGLALLPLLSRFAIMEEAVPKFGYYTTATHLNADALFLGFGVAYLLYYEGKKITAKARVACFLLLVTALVLLSIEMSPAFEYVFGRALVAVCFVSLLLLGVEARFTRGVGVRPVTFVAVTSYSVYLTHALVIHAHTRLFGGLAADYPLPFLVLLIAGIFSVGWAFFLVFERGALALRERWAPRDVPAKQYAAEPAS